MGAARLAHVRPDVVSLTAQSNAGKLEIYFYFRADSLPQSRRNLLE